MQGKKRKGVIPKQNHSKVRKKNELIHSYLCEPMLCQLLLGYLLLSLMAICIRCGPISYIQS
jgi:hypothetical protein